MIVHLTACLSYISTHFFTPFLAFLNKDGVALLGVHLLPDHGLVGGDVYAELLVVEVDIALRGGFLAVTCGPSVDQVLTVILQSIAGTTKNSWFLFSNNI